MPSKGNQSQNERQAIESLLESYDYTSRHLNKKEWDWLSLIEIERLRTSHVLAEIDGDVVRLLPRIFISLTNHPLTNIE